MKRRVLWASALTCVLSWGPQPAAAQSLLPPVTPADTARAEQFQARVEQASRDLENNPELRNLWQEQRKELFEFTVGNTLFALVHELGHALISEMGLPVLGREEDAADAFAVLTMLRIGIAFSHRVLSEASTGWFISDERDRKEGITPAFYDEHGLDKQRAYQIVCLMVGSDPDKFSDAANKVQMPEDRQGTCRGDYSNATWSWNTVLKPHLRAPDQPKQTIDSVYGPAEGRLAAIAQAFRTVRLLETLADAASDRYVWRRPITLEMQSCGAPKANWDLANQKITTCYELAADFAMLYRDYGFTPTKAFRRIAK
jgi:hypothetical protein